MSIERPETAERAVARTDAAAKRAATPLDLHLFTIGDLAVEFGVTLRALRFYETKGLLKPRRDGAMRRYSADDRRRLRQIIKGKQLGFTLREIIDLVATSSDIATPDQLVLTRQQCIEQLRLLERQKREIEDAILELRRTYSSLCKRAADENAGQWDGAAAANHSSTTG